MFKILFKQKINTFTFLLFSTYFISGNPILSSEDGLEHSVRKRKVIADEKAHSSGSLTEVDTTIFDWRDTASAMQQDNRPWVERAEDMALSWGISTEDYLTKADEYINFRIKKGMKTSGRTRQTAREGLILLPRPNIEKVNEQFSESYNKTFTEADFPMFKQKR
jgi:hypothetical protein